MREDIFPGKAPACAKTKQVTLRQNFKNLTLKRSLGKVVWQRNF